MHGLVAADLDSVEVGEDAKELEEPDTYYDDDHDPNDFLNRLVHWDFSFYEP